MWLFCRSKADIQHFINLILILMKMTCRLSCDYKSELGWIAQRVGASHIASVSKQIKHLTKQQAVFSNSTPRWSHAVKVGLCDNLFKHRTEAAPGGSNGPTKVWPFSRLLQFNIHKEEEEEVHIKWDRLCLHTVSDKTTQKSKTFCRVDTMMSWCF